MEEGEVKNSGMHFATFLYNAKETNVNPMRNSQTFSASTTNLCSGGPNGLTVASYQSAHGDIVSDGHTTLQPSQHQNSPFLGGHTILQFDENNGDGRDMVSQELLTPLSNLYASSHHFQTAINTPTAPHSVHNYSFTSGNRMPNTPEVAGQTIVFPVTAQQHVGDGGSKGPIMLYTHPGKYPPTPVNSPIFVVPQPIMTHMGHTLIVNHGACGEEGTTLGATVGLPAYQTTAHTFSNGTNALEMSMSRSISAAAGIPVSVSQCHARQEGALFLSAGQVRQEHFRPHLDMRAALSVQQVVNGRGKYDSSDVYARGRDGKMTDNGGALVESGSEDCSGMPFDKNLTDSATCRTQLMVNHIPHTLSVDEYRELFARCGELHRKHTKIIHDRVSGRCKGYGFVYYKSGESARQAIKTLDGYEIHGKALKVHYANQQCVIRDCDSYLGD
ncbi:hypothetical protein TRVL_03906 [Trypanosoma vivax]|uniref:RRM domain-containing protein n=1 Tax=Trypanosoma vivax (strain Y486) TaxID=1055687 RepID=G0U4W6_TRYVY|nr:hypothetical protein TRVL_03906 [Trypanosoma vivax]CCC52481.1 conserved hypothetical protein [Trypanosoma vivax Y486]